MIKIKLSLSDITHYANVKYKTMKMKVFHPLYLFLTITFSAWKKRGVCLNQNINVFSFQDICASFSSFLDYLCVKFQYCGFSHHNMKV